MTRHPKRLYSAVKSTIESLEQRQLLTTISGGGVDPITGELLVGEDSVFEYADAGDRTMRIVLGGNITANFAALQVHPGDTELMIEPGTKTVVDLRPAGVELPEGDVGSDLFKIVISAGDEKSFIAIAEVATSGNARPMTPFNGARDFEKLNIGPDTQVDALPGNTGSVFIGALGVMGGPDPEDVPITSVAYAGGIVGVDPNAQGRLVAGIESAPGVKVGSILIGGVVTGQVNMGASVETMYAGAWLTGNAFGQGRGTFPEIDDNFFVDGDIRNVIGQTLGTNSLDDANPIGDREYNTGFKIRATGRIGQVRSLSSFYGGVQADAARPTGEFSTHINEVENRFRAPFPSTSSDSFFQHGFIGDSDFLAGLQNDTFDTPQYLNTYFDSTLNEGDVAVVNGLINGSVNVDDYNDYYGVPLLAGQTLTVDLDAPGNLLQVGIFNPDGVLVDTDYTHLAGTAGDASTQNQPIQVVADRPGVWRVAVGQSGDQLFDGPATQRGVGFPLVSSPYTLTIRGAADINLGAVAADNSILFDANDSDSIAVLDGDFGAMVAGENIVSSDDSLPARYFVQRGNFRAMQANSIGYKLGGALRGAPQLHVRKGTVGLIHSTGTATDHDILLLNTTDASPITGFVDRTQAVGVDIQQVWSETEMLANLIAKRGIGIIRSQDLGNQDQGTIMQQSFFVANADGVGSDGVIGLIDIEDGMGNINTGGPAIDTGSNGNVRYISVGGAVFKDQFFGTGGPESITAPANTIVDLTDDSGTDMSLQPLAVVSGGGFGSSTGSGFQTNGTITYTAYPIRSASGARAGVVLIRVTSTTGLRVTSNPRGGNASVDLARIVVNGNGRQVRRPTPTAPLALVGGTAELAVDLQGDAPISALLITHDQANANAGRFSDISNSTNGEIVSVDARSIGRLAGRNIGLPSTTYGVALLPEVDRVLPVQPSNEPLYPFIDQRVSINVTGNDVNTINARTADTTDDGNVISIKASEALGNIIIDGDIDLVQANSNKKGVSGVFEGINAPVMTFGSMTTVDVGEGLLPSRAGQFAHSGLYAEGRIRSVGNQGAGSDIRGDIVSKTAIDAISLKDGAIINNDIAVLDDFEDTADTPSAFLLADVGVDTLENPVFEIGAISTTGVGGIIGSYIRAADIGPIRVSGGFGMFATTLQAGPTDSISTVEVDGYGVRSSLLDGGSRVQGVTANGNGTRLSTNTYTGSVRLSTNNAFDPFFGRPPSKSTDLHVFLGTTNAQPKKKGVSNSGIIADSRIIASRSLDSVTAWQIQSRNPFDALGNPIPFNSPQFPMRINFGNAIGNISTSSDIVGLALSSGGLTQLDVKGAIERSSFGISGRVKDFMVGGTFKGTSSLIVAGPDGALEHMTVGGSLNGQVNVSLGIASATVGGDFGSPSFLSTRNMDLIDIGGNVLSGARIRTKKTLVHLIVDGDVQAGATITARAISQQEIAGQVFGDIVITG